VNYCVLALLDALNTKGIKDDILLESWNRIDDTMSICIKKLQKDLKLHFYRHDLKLGQIFDNIQIVLPVDNPITSYTDLTGRNSLWWSIIHLGDLLIDLFRFAITNKIFLRGCITAGRFIETHKRIFGAAVNTAAAIYERSDWLGISLSNYVEMILNNAVDKYGFSYIFIDYDVPIKLNKNGGIVSKREKQKILNWTLIKDRRYLSMDHNIPTVSNDQIKSVIVEELEASHDESAKQKWKNTMDFFILWISL
jgi:hypothetical protein